MSKLSGAGEMIPLLAAPITVTGDPGLLPIAHRNHLFFQPQSIQYALPASKGVPSVLVGTHGTQLVEKHSNHKIQI